MAFRVKNSRDGSPAVRMINDIAIDGLSIAIGKDLAMIEWYSGRNFPRQFNSFLRGLVELPRHPTSLSLKKAESYMRSFVGSQPDPKFRFLFEIDSLSGRNMGELSHFKSDEEVLFLPGTKFEVRKVELVDPSRSDVSVPLYKIHLSEIP